MPYYESEIVAKGAFLSPEQEYHVIPDDSYILPDGNPIIGIIHAHNCIEINLMTEGGYIKQIINGNEKIIHQHYVCVCSRFDILQDIILNPCRCLSAGCREHIISEEILSHWDIHRGPITGYLNDEDFDRIHNTFRCLQSEYYSEQTARDSMIKSLFNILLLDIIRSVKKESVALPRKEEKFYTMLRYINEHFREDITLDDLAKAVYMSPAYLCRYFHKKAGTTFRDFLQGMRLEFAMNLVRSTNMTINAISIESGFSSFPHFSKVFKAKYGVSPSEIRKLQKES